jgi:hypothetical protein
MGRMSLKRFLVVVVLAASVQGKAQEQATRTVPMTVRVHDQGSTDVTSASVRVFLLEGPSRARRSAIEDPNYWTAIEPDAVGRTAGGVARINVPIKVGVATTIVVEVSHEDFKGDRRVMELDAAIPPELSFDFALEPAAGRTRPAQANEQTPINLVVQVLDDRGEPVTSGAGVSFFLPNGRRLGEAKPTNSNGEASFSSVEASDLPLDVMRRGILVKVEGREYETRTSQISSEHLQPALDTRAHSVQVERSWPELARAASDLQAVVGRIAADANSLPALPNRAAARDRALAAQRDAESRKTLIEAAFRELQARTDPAAIEACAEVQRTNAELTALDGVAGTQLAELYAALDQASALVQACTVPADGKLARARYLDALRAHAALARTRKKAQQLEAKLKPFKDKYVPSQQVADIRNHYAQVMADFRVTENASAQVRADAMLLAGSAGAIPGKVNAARAQVGALRRQHDEAVAWMRPSPASNVLVRIGNQLDAMTGQLSTASAKATAAEQDADDPVIAAAYNTVADVSRSLSEHFKSEARTICVVDTAAADRINDRLDSASFEIGLAGDLLAQADDCAKGKRPVVREMITPAGVEELPEDKPAATSDKPKDSKDSKEPKKPGGSKFVDVLNAINKGIQAINEAKKQQTGPQGNNGGRGEPPPTGQQGQQGQPGPPGSTGPPGTASQPPGSESPYGDLAGTWRITIPDTDQNCTVWVDLVLQPIAPRTWGGTDTWSDSGCKVPPSRSRSSWRIAITGPGAADATVVDIPSGNITNTFMTFTATTLSISNSPYTFTRK